MISRNENRRFLVGQIFVATLSALLLTYLSIAIADRETTPQVLRYVISPGYVLGLRFMSGGRFLDALGSFGRIAITVNMIYFGLISCFVLWKLNWPKVPRNSRHRFWMEL